MYLKSQHHVLANVNVGSTEKLVAMYLFLVSFFFFPLFFQTKISKSHYFF